MLDAIWNHISLRAQDEQMAACLDVIADALKDRVPREQIDAVLRCAAWAIREPTRAEAIRKVTRQTVDILASGRDATKA